MIDDKINAIRAGELKKAQDTVVSKFEDLASYEARYYAVDRLNGRSTEYMKTSEYFIKMSNELDGEINRIESEVSQIKIDIDPVTISERIKSNVNCCKASGSSDCSKKAEDISGVEPTEDLVNSFQKMDPSAPNPYKNCYWVKFAELATQFGLTPLIELSMDKMRYWPVGLMLPTPAGLVKIPMPIVWLPLVTISGSFGIIVIFIGQCGIVPSPYIFWVNNMFMKKFVITLYGPSPVMGYDGPITKESISIPLPIAAATLPDILFGRFLREANDLLSNKMSFDQMVGSLTNLMLDMIERYGLPDMTQINAIKRDVYDGASISIENVINSVVDTVVGYIDDIPFPKGRFPDNDIEMPFKKPIDKIKDLIIESRERRAVALMEAKKWLDIRSMIKREMSKVYDDSGINAEVLKFNNSLDLSDDATFKKVIAFYHKINDKIFEFLGKNDYILPLLYSDDIIISTSFDCIVKSNTADMKLKNNIGGSPFASFLGFAQTAIAGVISGLSSGMLMQMLGFGTISRSTLLNMFNILVDRYVPSMSPEAALLDDLYVNLDEKRAFNAIMQQVIAHSPINISDAMDLYNTMVALGMPQIKNGRFEFDFNATIKPLIIQALRSDVARLTSYLPEIASMSLAEYMHLQDVDLFAAVKRLIADEIKKNADAYIRPLYDLIYANSKITMFGMEINPIDLITLAGDYKDIIKKMKQAIIDSSSLSNFVRISNTAEIALALEQLKVLDMIPYPAVAAAVTYGGGQVESAIRYMHPLVNADELPPWERLTLNNFMFVLFLDEFCNTARDFGGMVKGGKFLP